MSLPINKHRLSAPREILMVPLGRNENDRMLRQLVENPKVSSVISKKGSKVKTSNWRPDVVTDEFKFLSHDEPTYSFKQK